MKLSELAERTGARVEGAGNDVEIVGAAGLDEASEGQVTFLANPRYRRFLAQTRAGVVVLDEKSAAECPVAALITKNPYALYARIAALFVHVHAPAALHQQRREYGTGEAGADEGDVAVVGFAHVYVLPAVIPAKAGR